MVWDYDRAMSQHVILVLGVPPILYGVMFLFSHLPRAKSPVLPDERQHALIYKESEVHPKCPVEHLVHVLPNHPLGTIGYTISPTGN